MAGKTSKKTRQADWDKNVPWTLCLTALTNDEKFGSEQVRHPGVAWAATMATATGAVQRDHQGRGRETWRQKKKQRPRGEPTVFSLGDLYRIVCVPHTRASCAYRLRSAVPIALASGYEEFCWLYHLRKLACGEACPLLAGPSGWHGR